MQSKVKAGRNQTKVILLVDGRGGVRSLIGEAVQEAVLSLDPKLGLCVA